MQDFCRRLYALWMREGIGGIIRHGLRRPSLRQRFVAQYAPKAGPGLEIGPSHSPLAPKAEGFHVEILDHASAQDLHEKYRNAGVNIDHIEDVDFVWRGEPLPETIGRRGCYDWIIASHVIEHTPDLVGFLVDCQALLQATGRLILVVPDKRYCFDHFQSLTSTGDVLDAHQLGRTRPSPGRVFDHFANAVGKGHNRAISWHRHAPGALQLFHDRGNARDAWRRAQTDDDYVDVHNWRFTPESFRLIIDDLRDLGLLELGITDGPTGAAGEFCACLQRCSSRPGDRIASLAAIEKAQR
ncbi:MAG: methyltransferase domain-containing protein [Rhodanobacteraceae bacterium]|nr:MAG: methyltransferase domain-containing protein [Rhodanobacteraceae bacterium]